MIKSIRWELITDVTKAIDKSKYYNITQNARLFASRKLSRLQSVKELMLLLCNSKVNDLFDEFINVYSVKLNLDFNLDENVPLLVLLLKYCNSSKLSDLSTSFGKFSLKTEYEQEYKDKRFKSWMFEKRSHTYNGSEEKFYSEFEQSVRNILLDFEKVDNSRRKLSIEEFINEVGLWGTAGSIYGVEIIDEVRDVVKKNKWSVALTSDKEMLISKIKNAIKYKIPVKYKSMQKSESTNVRYVVVADMITYLIEAYLSYHFESGLVQIESLFNFKNNEYKMKWFDKRRLLRILRKTILDIDYSGWDENVTLQMIYIVIKILQEVCLPEQEFNDFWDYILWAVYNSYLDEKKIENGLGSGRRWTTLLNSIINAAINDLAIRKNNSENKNLNYKLVKDILLVVLGDDSDGLFNNIEDAKTHASSLDSMGFSINMLKSKINEGEFLKINYNERGVSESPYRLFRSLLWSTEDERLNEKEMQVNARLDNWAKIVGRMLSYSKMFDEEVEIKFSKLGDVIVHDMWHVMNNKFTKNRILNFITTPSVIGGGGLSFIENKLGNKKRWVVLDTINDDIILNDKIGKKIEKSMASSKLLHYIDTALLQTMIQKNLKLSGSVDLVSKKDRKINKELLRVLMLSGDYIISESQKIDLTNMRNMFPAPDGKGYYTSAVLNRGHIRVSKVLREYSDNSFILDKNGDKFTKDTLIDFRFAGLLWSWKRRYSMSMLQLILDDDNSIITLPREMISLKGETAGSMNWLVLKPIVMSHFPSCGNTDNLLGILGSLGMWMRTFSFKKWLDDKNFLNTINIYYGKNVHLSYKDDLKLQIEKIKSVMRLGVTVNLAFLGY